MITKAKRKIVFYKYGGYCAYCGRTIKYKQLHVDHIIPKARWHRYKKDLDYDVDGIENLNPSCSMCNTAKKALSVEGFRKNLQKQLKYLNRYHFKYKLVRVYKLIVQRNIKIKFYFEICKEKGKVK